jgi:PAS domain S-box-containing protein
MQNEFSSDYRPTGSLWSAPSASRIDEMQAVLDELPVMFVLADPSGRIEFVNRCASEYVDGSLHELRDWLTAGVMHPEDRDVVAEWPRALSRGVAFESKYRLRRRDDGAYRWFHVHASPRRNHAGLIVAWQLLAVDIQDRTRAEATLAGEKHLLEMIASGRPLSEVLNALCRFFEEVAVGCLCGVYPVDWNGPTFRNAVAPSLPASYLATVDGLPVRPDVAPCGIAALFRTPVIVEDIDSDPAWRESTYRSHVLAHGLRAVWSTPITSLDGGILGTFCIYWRIAARPTVDEQEMIAQVTHIASIAIDNKRRETELGRTRSELAHVARVTTVSALTVSIAHEINQPLSGILTNASTCLRMLAADPPNVEAARETVRRTIRDGNRAAEVIARLRALFSRKEFIRESLDLNEATREVIALSLSDLQRNRVVVQSELADDVPRVTGDRIQLQQVILNLLRNASDAMSDVNGRPRQLLVRTERDTGNLVRLTVRDVGVGLAEVSMDQLFDPFYTTKRDGMGVGLSVSRSIIESHHGQIWAAPNDGSGATFAFSIPAGV